MGNANVWSTGWKTYSNSEWATGYGAGDINLGYSSDLGGYYTYLYSVKDSIDKGGVVLVYGKVPSTDSSGTVCLLPFKKPVSGGGKSGTVEFRFGYNNNPKYAEWLLGCAVLISGTWDENYIKNTFLPKVQFCSIFINASNLRTSSPAPDYSDYHAVCKYYGLQE